MTQLHSILVLIVLVIWERTWVPKTFKYWKYKTERK